MTFDYTCSNGHIQEEFFRSISAAAAAKDVLVNCTVCGEPSKRNDVQPPPTGVMFYGNPEGYYKPSPSKRWSHKHRASWGNAPQPQR